MARLREAGAVILGKTTTPEFGWKALGDSPLTGITRNPWDLSRSSGGSSAGAAAAAAAGIAPLHLGSDGAGSIRTPSAFCGIFGLKPSFGRVPAYPPSPLGLLSHHGPIARTVADAALMLGVLCRPDHRDPYALPPDDRDWRDGHRGRRQGLAHRLQPGSRLCPGRWRNRRRGRRRGAAVRGAGRHRRRGRPNLRLAARGAVHPVGGRARRLAARLC